MTIHGVLAVLLGIDVRNECHFMALRLSEHPEAREIQAICELLEHHFLKNNVFVQREFIGDEIHLHPSAKSAEYFETRAMAIAEYQKILKTLGLDAWSNEIVMDGSLLPFAERSELRETPKVGFRCRRNF